jgi:hypothetical protein
MSVHNSQGILGALQLMNGLRRRRKVYVCLCVYVCMIHTHAHTYTLEFYLAIRKNETMWFEGKWMQLGDIMLSEVG